MCRKATARATAGRRAARYLRLSSGRGALGALIAGGVILPTAGNGPLGSCDCHPGGGPWAP